MLGVGGLSFSRGIGTSMATVGFMQKAGSKKDSSNFPFTFAPLETDSTQTDQEDGNLVKTPSDPSGFFSL